MDAQLEAKLIEGLDALAQGESVEQILARYPQQAAQLRPLLQTAAGLPALRMEPSEAVKMRSRQKFQQRRRDEANELLDAEREGEVEFTGPIESIQPGAWIVGGLAVQVDANTSIAGTPQINRVAEVKGVTGPGGLRAASITIESPGEADQTPEPENTATPEVRVSTQTPRPSSTPATTDAPTRTPAPAASGTPTATPSPTTRPRPTATPQPTATAEPVEVEFTGSVQAIEVANWNIDGTTIGVNANTEIRGSINVGQRVKVKARRQGNGQLIAIRIEPIEDSGSGGGGSSGGNDNQNDPATPTSDDNRNENGDQNQNDDNDNKNENQNSNDDNSNEDENGNENDNSGNGN